MFIVIPDYGGVDAHPLDAVRLVASALGIHDVDVEQCVGGKVTIHSQGRPSVTGKNEDEACRLFLKGAFDV